MHTILLFHFCMRACHKIMDELCAAGLLLRHSWCDLRQEFYVALRSGNGRKVEILDLPAKAWTKTDNGLQDLFMQYSFPDYALLSHAILADFKLWFDKRVENSLITHDLSCNRQDQSYGDERYIHNRHSWM